METTSRPGAPLRHRMLDNMSMRMFAEHTQEGYIRAVRKPAAFLGRSPDTATTEDLRRFQLHLVDAGTGPVTINATITGLKFFFDVALGQPDVIGKMQHVHVPRKLPVILSPVQGDRAGIAQTQVVLVPLLSVPTVSSTANQLRWPRR